MFFRQDLIHTQHALQISRSAWIASCLPQSEALIKKHKDILEAVDRYEITAEYRSVMDAVVACLLPELKPAMNAFYAKRGPSLSSLPKAQVEQYDQRLADFLRIIAPLNLAEQQVLILSVRSQWDLDSL